MKINKIIASVVTIVLAIVATGVIAKQVKLSSTENKEYNFILSEDISLKKESINNGIDIYINFDIISGDEGIEANEFISFIDFELQHNSDDIYRYFLYNDNNMTMVVTYNTTNEEISISKSGSPAVSVTLNEGIFSYTETKSGIAFTLVSLLPLIFAGAVITFIYTRKDLSL